MRVFFVGIHFKKGLKALDSSTLSGQVIDKIIQGLNIDPASCIKCNLFPGYKIPDDSNAKYTAASNLIKSHRIDVKHDCVVLLGTQVQYHFNYQLNHRVNIYHPAYPKSEELRSWYIADAIKRINLILNTNN